MLVVSFHVLNVVVKNVEMSVGKSGLLVEVTEANNYLYSCRVLRKYEYDMIEYDGSERKIRNPF